MMTPVDTGRARGNWQAAVGAPVDVEIDRLDPSGGETIAAASRALIGLGAFKTIFITNNVPYIQALENGNSKQAPAGMVAIALSEVEGIFE